MRPYQCGTTLMSLATSCTLASLLLSLGKNLSFNKKMQKTKHLNHQALKFLLFMLQSFILQHTFRRKTNRKSFGKCLKRGVCACCMWSTVKIKSQVNGTWSTTTDTSMHNFFISLTSRGALIATTSDKVSPKKNPASMWPGKANNQVGGKQEPLCMLSSWRHVSLPAKA